MDLADLMELAQKFSNMGDAIGSQLMSLLGGEVDTVEDIADLVDRGELNPNVLSYADDFLKLVQHRSKGDLWEQAKELRDVFAEYRRAAGDEARA